MITTNLSSLKIHKLTQNQFDRELANGNIDDNALYLTPDESADVNEVIKSYLVVSDTEPNAADYPEGALWIKPL